MPRNFDGNCELVYSDLPCGGRQSGWIESERREDSLPTAYGAVFFLIATGDGKPATIADF
ncbi:MAG: hypothetical protein LBE56_12355 [Tannerella sp.]|nr:hypothetical protein [Tannerella sp.]